jgi:hypothetical protein
VLATFVHELVAATSTDCSISLAWKEEIAGDGMLRGFVLTCTLRSISSTPGVFEPEFTQHPSMRFPEKQRMTLGPGETSSFDVPIIWNRSARDNEGWNHPRTIEVGVAVTHGRRSATAPWDLVQQHIEPYMEESDRAPLVVRRPPPPQFTTPGGGAPSGAPAVSPLAVVALPEPALGAPANETPSARIARAEMEAGVTVGGIRLPPPVHVPPRVAPPRETVTVAPGTLMLVGLAIAAIAVVLVVMLRMPVNTSAVSTGPVPVASQIALTPEPAAHRPKPKPHSKQSPAAANPGATAQPDVASTPSGSTTHSVAATPKLSVATHAAAASASHTHKAATPQRVSPADRGALVQLNGVGAEYARSGRQVHVFWDSYAQARADVQVLDSRNVIVAETTVGRRMAALLNLPRGYRGSVYVQVTAIGYDGERVVNSTSLGPP